MKRNKKLIFFAMILLASFISLALIGCPADAELPSVTPTDNSQWSPQTPSTPPKISEETPSLQTPSTPPKTPEETPSLQTPSTPPKTPEEIPSPQVPFTPPKIPEETPSPQVPSTIPGSEKVNSSDTSTKPLTGKSIVFVEGVSQESGWYDVNKVGRGENGDINMCWAASASNIIQWWQDRYVAAGNTLPPQAVTGAGKTYELALMEIFHTQWNNDKGGQVAEAVPWYFEGVDYGQTASKGSQAYPLSAHSGGYFKDVWSTIYPRLYHEYSYMLEIYKNLYVGDFNNYYIWGAGSELMGEQRLRKFTELVVDFVDKGIASLTVSLSPNLRGLLHATTIWGYEIDHETGLLTRLWITDSDDLEKEPKKQLLNEYRVSVGSGNSHIKLSSNTVRYGACYAVSLTPVSGYKKQ